jgi:hypothetical protein
MPVALGVAPNSVMLKILKKYSRDGNDIRLLIYILYGLKLSFLALITNTDDKIYKLQLHRFEKRSIKQ